MLRKGVALPVLATHSRMELQGDHRLMARCMSGAHNLYEEEVVVVLAMAAAVVSLDFFVMTQREIF